MVKGVSRRVVVVRLARNSIFEEAMFILRPDAKGASQEEIMREACSAAEKYTRTHALYGKRISAPLFAAAGAALTAAAWLLTALV